jgi:hypothetical protein
MKKEMKQSKKKSKSSNKYETNQSDLGQFGTSKIKEKYQAQLESLTKQFEKERDDWQLKCNVLMQDNKELKEKNELLEKGNKDLQDGFNEYIKNQEHMDNSIMRINPNDESTLTINRSLLNVFEGQEIKNVDDFENFLQNLSLAPNDQEAVNKFWKKQRIRMDKESRWINKLKRIINELLGNYQKLIEKELPDLQEHHDIVLESLKENERKHIIAFNDKILGILNKFFNENEKLKEEVKKKSKTELNLRKEMEKKEEENKNVLKGMKKKMDRLKKCMNICFTKFKEFKKEKMAPQNVQYRIDLKGFDSFSSHLVSLDNTKRDNAFSSSVGNKRILKFMRGRKKK